MKKIKFIDLFSGLGGFRIALENLGAKCEMSSEIDEDVRKVYTDNFGDIPLGDITKIKTEEIVDHDILCAGFPCQPFSIAGKRLGFEDTRGTLFFEILRILEIKKPKAFLLENVAGILNHDRGHTIKVIKEELEKIGYVIEYKLMNAKDYGIPQNRNRWYCVGFDKKYKNKIDFKFPEKKVLDVKLNEIIEKNISDEKYNITKTCKFNIDNFIESVNENENTLLAYDIRKSRCRFRNDGISPCLTAKMGTGGNNIPVVVKSNRILTERECLSIMGFPKDYNINRSLKSYKQIGNSVVVPIIEEIAKEIIKNIDRF